VIFFKRKWRGLIVELQDVDKQLQLASIKLSMARNLMHDRKRRASFLSNVTVITAMHGLPVTPDMLGSLFVRDAHNSLRSVIRRLKWICDKVREDPKYFRIIRDIEILIKDCEELLKVANPQELLNNVDNIRSRLRELLVEVEGIEFISRSYQSIQNK